MLSRPILRGRIGKWILALSEFSFQYVPAKAVKGQAIADFLAHHPSLEDDVFKDLEIGAIFLKPWALYFDGSRTEETSGAGIVLQNPEGLRFSYSFQLDFVCTNNQAEYEALIIGLEILLELKAYDIDIYGDSLLVVNQVIDKFKCASPLLAPYLFATWNLLSKFSNVYIEHILREKNFAANELAQVASGIKLTDGIQERILKVERRSLPSVHDRGWPMEVSTATMSKPSIDLDWRKPLIQYLENPNQNTDKRTRFRALNFFLRNKELRRRGEDGVDFMCVFGREAKRLMREIHSGTCGSHQAGPKMRWLLRRHGYYWPTILKDCITFAKGCQECQRHGPIHRIPNIPMQPIVKPWPFRGWAMDFIGMISPPSSKQHHFIIVATDFFTKWVEAEPMKHITADKVKDFIFDNLICRFGVPECIITDRGTSFMAEEVVTMTNKFGIKLLHSTPYYAQSNGQAEASNKIIINILKKMVADNPRDWHNELYNTLWAYRTSKRTPTATTPYALTFGHDAMLPMEIFVQSLRVREQHQLIGEDYVQAMWQEHEILDESRLETLNNLIAEKQKVARAYDKRTRGKSFKEGELVWKMVLPVREKTDGLGKWSPKWEGPHVIHQILPKGAYHLKHIDGEIHYNPINGKYLKKYYPSVWDFAKRVEKPAKPAPDFKRVTRSQTKMAGTHFQF
jgi:ribonuclease HI